MSGARKPIVFISYSHLDEPEKPSEANPQWATFVIGFLRAALRDAAEAPRQARPEGLSRLSREGSMDWQLQEAKNRLSELIKRARSEGPQTVTLRGERAAVVLSAEDYDRLTSVRPTLVDHLLSGPAWDDELVESINARAKTPSRPVES